MFRCVECNLEYEIKPDYCDCGNDIFIETEEENEAQKNETQIKPEIKEEPVFEKREAINFKKDLPSVIFFVICLLLSILSIVFIGNKPDTTEIQAPDVKQEVQKKKIADINKLWTETAKKTPQNNAPSEQKPKLDPVKKEEPVVVQNIKPKTQNQTIQTQNQTKNAKNEQKIVKNAQNNTKITQNPANIKPKNTTPSSANNQKNTVSKNTNNTTSKTNSGQNLPKNDASKPKDQPKNQPVTGQTAQTKVQPNVQPSAQSNVQPKSQTNTQAASNVQANLKSYKTALRNKIASNIAFVRVIGDGTCAVKFRVNSNGTLVDRKFSIQSENDSLNEVVYQAIMSTPSYTPPPYGYRGEVLELKVRMYGGNFEVTLQ